MNPSHTGDNDDGMMSESESQSNNDSQDSLSDDSVSDEDIFLTCRDTEQNNNLSDFSF